MNRKKHHGSSLDDFLNEEGVFAAVEATARGLHDAGAMNRVTLRAFEQFRERLDRPATPNDRLRRTMRTKLPWKAG